MRLFTTGAIAALAFLGVLPPMAQAQQMPFPYGDNIGFDTARKLGDAAIADARKNNWKMAVAIVDTHGTLVFFQRMDDVQYGSIHVAQEKARSAAEFRRPTKVFEDAVKGPALNLIGLPGAVPVEGGVPIVLNGRVMGAIGLSGGTSAQDGQVAKAALEAIGATLPAAPTAGGQPGQGGAAAQAPAPPPKK
jgi:glc operon protein GlcG